MKIRYSNIKALLLVLFFALLNNCNKQVTKTLPDVSIATTTGITSNSATAGGTVTADGGDPVIARGVCWSSTNTAPSISDNKTSDGKGTGSFSSSIVGLNQGTTYNLRAYASNSVGTVYSSVSSFKTLALAPTISTADFSAINAVSFNSGGNVTNDGGSSVTSRGVCWSTNQNPSVTDNKTSDGSGTGIFASTVTGLTPGTTYYVRSYATNSIGTAYGNQLTAKTSAVVPTLTTTIASSITTSTAISGGNITSDGGAPITARGVCWSTTSGPTTASSKTSDNTGIGNFTSTISGLTANTTYYVRAYATNSAGTTYASEISLKTLANLPTLSTTAVTSITNTTAISGGNITFDGGAIISSRGICWSTAQNPTISDSKTTDGTGTGSYTSFISGLALGTTYYVRAYATSNAGTSYGSLITFTTNSAQSQIPTLTTMSVTSITTSSATSGGSITSDGGGTIISKGVCWSTTINPTTSNNKTTDGTGTGSFTSSISGLALGTTYYVRAYATNNAGTAYGSLITFTTNSAQSQVPILTTTNVTSITSYSAIIGGNITNEGGGTVTERGICWSSAPNPTTSNNKIINGWGAGTYSCSITGLTQNTIYYVRAYAKNIAGTGYGPQVTFTTNQYEVPTLTTTIITSLTASSAISGGKISSYGGLLLYDIGVCWNTSPNPTIANFKTIDQIVNDNFTSSLNGLKSETTYYVRAYATNPAGTGYGQQITFKTNFIQLPTVTTNSVKSITSSFAVTGYSVTSDGGGSLSATGICWSTNVNPTTADNKTSQGASIGNFITPISGLSSNTTYHIRAYSTNSAGTAYGGDVYFTTKSNTGGIYTDVDGNTYSSVIIGTQVWMSSNLKVTKYNDGTAIPLVTDNTAWNNVTPAYCWYNNDIGTYKNNYGALYNWYTINTGKLCPIGWHIPSGEEWGTLTSYFNGDGVAGGNLKETGTSHWISPNVGATNTVGFTALPGGFRDSSGFYLVGSIGMWWASDEAGFTNALQWSMVYQRSNTLGSDYPKKSGLSVRCLLD